MKKEEKILKKAIKEHRQQLSEIYHEQSFRLLVKNVKDYALYMLDREGYIVSWNDGAENIKGYRANEIIGQHFSCFYTEEDKMAGKPKEGLEQAKLKGHFEREDWRLRKDGSKFWANVTISPVKDDFGELIGFAKVTRDMTEHKQAQERQNKLQKSIEMANKEWQETFASIESPIIIMARDGQILRFNKAAKDLINKNSYSEIINSNIKDFAKCEPWKTIAESLKTIKGEHSSLSYQIKDSISNKSWDISISHSLGEESNIERIIVVAKDISRIVKLQESLNHSEMMSALGSLVAGVAHEVRNPLFSMTATLDAFQEGFPNHPEYQEYLDVLRGELTRLTFLMRDLLEYGKPSNQKLLPGLIDVVIMQAIKACEHLSYEKKVPVVCKINPALPNILMEETRLAQVFQNLIDNAIQHSPPNSVVDILATIVYKDEQCWIEVTIQDQGTGFAKNDLPRVFEPFFSHRPGGTGLGLSIVQKILEHHKGKIFINNNPNGGAIVKVLLPAISNKEEINVEK